MRVGLYTKLSTEELMLLNSGVGEDSWQSLGLQGDPTCHPKGDQSFSKEFVGKTDAEAETRVLLVTSCKELTHWERPWCWEGLGAGGDGDDRRRDGWMASPTRSTWVCVNSRSWWWTGGLVCCDSWGHKESETTERLNWTELNWTELIYNTVTNYPSIDVRKKSDCVVSHLVNP